MRVVLKNRIDDISSEHMKIISILPVGFQKSLKLVQVGREFLLLAVSQIQVSLVCKVEDPETIDVLRLESSFLQGKDLEKASFLNWWTKKEEWKNGKEVFAEVK